MRGLDEERGEPKYARLELERRWLVSPAARPSLETCPSTLIYDRYISGTRLRMRRMQRPDLGETKWKLTKKYECEDPAARPIVSLYLTEAEYRLLAGLPARELTKRRLHLQLGGSSWSLDIFSGALEGLEILEAETEDRRTLDGLEPPGWAVREITHLPQWQGGAIALAQRIPEE